MHLDNLNMHGLWTTHAKPRYSPNPHMQQQLLSLKLSDQQTPETPTSDKGEGFLTSLMNSAKTILGTDSKDSSSKTSGHQRKESFQLDDINSIQMAALEADSNERTSL